MMHRIFSRVGVVVTHLILMGGDWKGNALVRFSLPAAPDRGSCTGSHRQAVTTPVKRTSRGWPGRPRRFIPKEIIMRTFKSTLLTLSLLLMTGWGSADTDSARGVVEQAIMAHGGAEVLAKTRVQLRSTKGEIGLGRLDGTTVPFVGETMFNLPALARWSFDLQPESQKFRVILVFNRDKGWRAGSGATKDLTKEEIDEFREEAYTVWLTTLLPLRDKQFELTSLPEAKVLGQPALVVKVASKGHPDVKLFFNKQTHLLVKTERKAREAGLDLSKESYFGDHKEFEGVKLPTKQVDLSNGKKAADLTITGYRFPGRLDDRVFDKP
jgi:hypothetical protein